MGDLELEVHLTVEGCSASRLATLGGELRCDTKVIEIVLEQGDEPPRQVMLTWYHRDGVDAASAEAARISASLACQNLRCSRVKIEAPVDGLEWGVGRYLEHHVLVRADARSDALRWIASRHGAALSRTPRRISGKGQVERFINQRWWDPDSAVDGMSAFDRMANEVASAGLHIVERIHERVLLDTNQAIDGGWLPETIDARKPA